MRRTTTLAIASALVAAVLALFVIYKSPTLRYWRKIRNTEKVVARLEDYKARNGRYPEMNDWPAFKVKGVDFDGVYFYSTAHDQPRVGFATGWDHSCYYDLVAKRWEFRAC